MTDKELLQASLKGNPQAYGQIVERYQSLVCAIAYNATGNVTLSEDIAQETFVAAWQRLGEIRDIAKFRSWLCRIARNLAVGALRKGKRDPVANAQEIEALSSHVVSETSPREDAITKEEQNLLWQAIEKIPEGYRIPLILFYREGQSIRCVAQTLGLSPNNVKQRLHRGRQMVRDELTEFVESTLARTKPKTNMAPAVLAALPPAQGGLVAAAIGGARQFLAGVCSGSPAHLTVAVAGVLLVIAGSAYIFSWNSESEAVEPPVQLAASPIILGEVAPQSVRESLPAATSPSTVPAVEETDAAVLTEGEGETEPASQEAMEEQLRLERIDLAKGELEKGWRDQPMQAASLMCLKGWAYLAMQGDDEAHQRLLDLVYNMHERMHTATWYLLKYLNDTTAKDYLEALFKNKNKPFSQRLGAYEGSFQHTRASSHYRTNCSLQRPIPEAIEAYYRNAVVESGYGVTPLATLASSATERSLPFFEDVLMTYAFDRSSPKSSSRHRRVRITSSMPPQSGAETSACHAKQGIRALKGIPGPDSIRVLREVALDGEPPWLRRHAVEVLSELGDESFAMDLAYERVKEDDDLRERMGYAFILAKNGDDSYLQMVRDNLYHSEEGIRERAYVILCELGDPSFIRPATLDISESDGEPLAYHFILPADSRRMSSPSREFPQQGTADYMSDLMCEYLFTLAAEALSPYALALGLAGLQSGSDDQLRRFALPLALGVLQEVPVSFPSTGKLEQRDGLRWLTQVTKLQILMRVGGEATQNRALSRIEEMYDASDDFARENMVLYLTWCRNPKVAPFLAKVITENPKGNVRLVAATALLAMEAGVIPE